QKLPKGFSDATIVGVVEDFHYYPLHRKIDPLVFHMPRHDNLSSLFEIAVRVRSDDVPATLARIENAWDRTSNGKPFAYEFVDETVDQQYADERRWREIVRNASALSILITCLGLFGLTSLAAAKRTREIGIRKVLGATESNIVRLVSKEFIVLAAIGIAVASPIGYLSLSRWLDRFAYHPSLGWETIALAGSVSLAIALTSVSVQALKAARANPVDSIKYE
ncbi:MAG: FtsX-like permease family protein, partial [candidate division Zixibacteria bacterium]|nr:FtsX-like permease family protein [candidate division Zixibacteria bacterium]